MNMLSQEVNGLIASGDQDTITIPPLGDRGMSELDGAIFLHVFEKAFQSEDALLDDALYHREVRAWTNYQRWINI